ncbi:MAG TPA: phytoene desaturase family protein [Mycobacteriales bacterium]|nr:phytoene desaturase family protein [Mycobacteriales bacterium]
MARIVVIGAGVGGLSAAARLAALGHQVTVCEQAPEVGGKLGLHERDGFRFDTGPSLLTMPHLLRELFDDTGSTLDEAVTLRPVVPIAHYRFADGAELDSTGDLDAFAATLDDVLAPGSGADWRRIMARAEQIWAATHEDFLESALEGSRTLLRQATRVGDLRTVAPWTTLRGLGRRYLRDPRLRMLLDRYATYTGSDPRRAPAALAVVPWVEQTFGGWYVEGGLSRIGEAIRDRVLERGAVVRTGADVVEVRIEGGRVRGVRLADGELLPADLVVANADATHLYRDLVSDPRTAAVRRRLARATPSLSGFVLLLGLRGRTPDLAHHTVLFPRNYDAEFDSLFGATPRPVLDPTIYLSVPTDAAIAPPGHEAWFVLVNAPRQGQAGRDGPVVDWGAPGVADAYAEHLLDLLRDRGHDVRERIVSRTLISPVDLERRTRAVGGAIYGTSSNGVRAAFLRPANRSPVPGMYLVGGSAHPGGGLPLVLLSARIVAGLVGPAG